MVRRIPRDIWIGLATLVLAGVYWYGADQIPISPLDGAVNASAMPKALAYTLGALAVILILRALSIEAITRRATADAAARPAAQEEDAAAEPEEGEATTSPYRKHLRAAGMLAIGLIYLTAVPYLGYLVSIALLVFGVATYMQAKPNRKLLLLAAAIAVFFYLLFVRFLDIPLPPGFWPVLYQ